MGRIGQARDRDLRIARSRRVLTVALASFKLRFQDNHVRALPARDDEGFAFAGPGVDLRGEEARAILALAGPVRAWLEAREPDVVLRSLSIDVHSRRVLMTLQTRPGERPRVVRVDAPESDVLLAGVAALQGALVVACATKLRQRLALRPP